MKNVVVIGGGTGQSALLKGLKQIKNINLATIVTVADDGGSTGRLRNDLNIPAMGDVRNVMLALAESESLTSTLMDYRFDNNSGSLAGHNLGNIILGALIKKSGSFVQAIDDLDKVLRVRGDVIPSTISNVTLCAHMMDGTVVEGEHNITFAHKRVKDVFYKKYVTAYPDALVAIRQADYIIIGIGSVYTSIMPNIIIDDIKKELCEAKGKVVYYCNCMTEAGETDDYSMEDHVDAIHRHLGKEIIDAVVMPEEDIPAEILSKYQQEKAAVVKAARKEHDYHIFTCPLLSFSTGMVRHDADKVRDSFIKVMEEL